MNREEWLQERMRGLGGSDAAAALGLSKWKTPYQLYLEKRGEAPPIEETEPMRWGKLLEPVVIQRYADLTGREVQTFPNELHWNKEVPFMFVTPDGIAKAEGYKRGVEAKTARTKEAWGEPGTDQIPQEYLIQVHHFMIVERLPVVDVPVLFGGQEFEMYEVPADKEIADMICDGEAEFWHCVESGTPPEPVNLGDVQRRYGARSIPNSVQAPPEIANAAQALKAMRELIKHDEEEAERLEVQIKAFLAENDTLLAGGNTLATWKLDKQGRSTLDAAGLKERFPQIYEMFAGRAQPSRRFLLK